MLKNIKTGIQIGLGFMLVVLVSGISFAAYSWIVEDDIVSGNSLTASSWNNILNNQRYLKEQVEGLSGVNLGIGQTWLSYTGIKTAGNQYQNQTGKPIQVSVTSINGGSANDANLFYACGELIGKHDSNYGVQEDVVTWIVPDGCTYEVVLGAQSNCKITSWYELR